MVIDPEHPHKLKASLIKLPLVLYGAGDLGIKIAEYCLKQEINVNCFVDQHKKGELNGIPILLPNLMLKKYRDANIVITSNIYFKEIKQNLLSSGFNKNQIISYEKFVKADITWGDLEEGAKWDRMETRVSALAEWIDENDKSVVDYGAGEMYLKKKLHGDVEYYPVDYIQRHDEIILCDLNDKHLPLITADVIVLSGVIEFIRMSDRLLEHVTNQACKKILLSYITTNKFPDSSARRSSAYINDYSHEDLVKLFTNNGFRLVCTKPDPNHSFNDLFYFEKAVS